jgi:hypothetical protein
VGSRPAERPARRGPAGPDPGGQGRARGGVKGTAKELVPDHEDEAEVDGAASIDRHIRMVKAVIRRAHEDPSQGPEGEAEIGVSDHHEAGVGDERSGRYRAARPENEHRDGGREVGHMDEGMHSKRGEDAHVFLGVVDGVQSPQRQVPVIGDVRGPVDAVDPDEDRADHRGLRHEGQAVEDQEARMPRHFEAEAGLDDRQDRQDDDGEEGEVGGVDEMGPSKERPADGRPHELGAEEHGDDDEDGGPYRVGPGRGQHARQVAGVTELLQSDEAEADRDAGDGKHPDPRLRPPDLPDRGRHA